MKCFHEFRIYQFFSQFFSYFLLKLLMQNSSIEIKKCIYNYSFSQNKKFFAKINRRFIDAKFVKTCHEQVISQDCACFNWSKNSWKFRFIVRNWFMDENFVILLWFLTFTYHLISDFSSNRLSLRIDFWRFDNLGAYIYEIDCKC